MLYTSGTSASHLALKINFHLVQNTKKQTIISYYMYT
jgi:hypothetical protein